MYVIDDERISIVAGFPTTGHGSHCLTLCEPVWTDLYCLWGQERGQCRSEADVLHPQGQLAAAKRGMRRRAKHQI